jgi:hypothetical protein
MGNIYIVFSLFWEREKKGTGNKGVGNVEERDNKSENKRGGVVRYINVVCVFGFD